MVKNTLNVGSITEGFVLDHIEAGKSMEIYKYLHLDKLDCCVAIIKNARSNKMGKKDIMKIECPERALHLPDGQLLHMGCCSGQVLRGGYNREALILRGKSR